MWTCLFGSHLSDDGMLITTEMTANLFTGGFKWNWGKAGLKYDPSHDSQNHSNTLATTVNNSYVVYNTLLWRTFGRRYYCIAQPHSLSEAIENSELEFVHFSAILMFAISWFPFGIATALAVHFTTKAILQTILDQWNIGCTRLCTQLGSNRVLCK